MKVFTWMQKFSFENFEQGWQTEQEVTEIQLYEICSKI